MWSSLIFPVDERTRLCQRGSGDVICLWQSRWINQWNGPALHLSQSLQIIQQISTKYHTAYLKKKRSSCLPQKIPSQSPNKIRKGRAGLNGVVENTMNSMIVGNPGSKINISNGLAKTTKPLMLPKVRIQSIASHSWF